MYDLVRTLNSDDSPRRGQFILLGKGISTDFGDILGTVAHANNAAAMYQFAELCHNYRIPSERNITLARELLNFYRRGIDQTILHNPNAGRAFPEDTDLVEKFLGTLDIAKIAFDGITRTHIDDLTTHIIDFSRFMGYSEVKTQLFGFGAETHDMGKKTIGQQLIQLPRLYRPEERERVKGHVVAGQWIMDGINNAMMRLLSPEEYASFNQTANYAIEVIGRHHEWKIHSDLTPHERRILGSYCYTDVREKAVTPMTDKMAELIEELKSRIQVFDAVDAMRSRSYEGKPPKTHRETIEELKKYRGIQFDEEAVDLIVPFLEEFEIEHGDDRKEYLADTAEKRMEARKARMEEAA